MQQVARSSAMGGVHRLDEWGVGGIGGFELRDELIYPGGELAGEFGTAASGSFLRITQFGLKCARVCACPQREA
ncbi:hypothetical protein ACWIB8_04040 [Corynebacterium flavescens]